MTIIYLIPLLGYTSHPITDSGDESIVVELGTICIINHIKLLLWDKDTRSYSYYIETSVDQNNWTRVIDYTKYPCRSWQFLYFPSCAVRYIKLVGTHNTANDYFHAVALEAYYATKTPNLLDGLVSPITNIATTLNGAAVIKGSNPDALLNGNVTNYDGTSGFTHHILGNERDYDCTLIKLWVSNQKYTTGSPKSNYSCKSLNHILFIHNFTSARQIS